ncbi:HNH endonuclease signature motif containing protein [Bacillus atrophaeus]|nr:HNH endonuclease signature motif containing protein [Bacillus atrophaeus]MCY8499672.1 HNH endonuclease [Bacillus atrophaeus]MCY8814521.1 HNH endonuclease [Bacillus atrophaeus]MCY8831207.1 HNH endonuclease [Bacillus atrophaeus]MCY8834994.1 HNH endonuclease [Bacillus atrophaeus]MEC0748238.1 HNH endonuclease signature motif containing protein [Bacillus atrophaeus]
MYHYLWFLCENRNFTKENAITYTQRVYDLDISQVIDKYPIGWSSCDIFKRYEKESKTNRLLKNTRDEFNKIIRPLYVKFIDDYFYDKEDCLDVRQRWEEIHHIHPLVYGGTNSLHNLIHLSCFNHSLLHNNPLEQFELENHKALCYLGSLYSALNLSNLFKKYDFHRYKNNETILKAIEMAVHNEMSLYYEKLELLDKPFQSYIDDKSSLGVVHQ